MSLLRLVHDSSASPMLSFAWPPLFVLRHAPVQGSGICYGRLDLPAPIQAEEASRLATELLREFPEDQELLVFSSPLQRCRTLAESLCARWGARVHAGVQVDSRLSELDFGEFEGRSYQELSHDPAFQHWMSHYQSARPPGGETLPEFIERLRDFMESRARGNQALVLVTHAGVLRMLRHLLLDTPVTEALGAEAPHLTWFLFDPRPEAPSQDDDEPTRITVNAQLQ